MTAERYNLRENYVKKLDATRQLEIHWSHRKNICIGLDPDPELMPESLKDISDDPIDRYAHFLRGIIKQTHHLASVFKPNLAYFEALGEGGYDVLKNDVVDELFYSRSRPLVLLDGKRGDIGRTNEFYAKYLFDDIGADAITLTAHTGFESLKPFFERKNKLVFVWNKSSDEPGGEMQDRAERINQPKSWADRYGSIDELASILIDKGIREDLQRLGYEDTDAPAFLIDAYKMARDWNVNGNLGLVVGATHPRELGWVRKVVGDIPILVPGIGAQEGSLGETIKNGLNSQGEGLIISASRSILYASRDENFAQAAKTAAQNFQWDVNSYKDQLQTS